MSDRKNTASIVREAAEPIARSLGLELWDVRFQKEGQNHYLRVMIDKPGGVTLDDCVAMSRALDERLDELDPIEQSYNLQVSSPGVERELRRDEHFVRYVGSKVFLRTHKAIDGAKSFKGELKSYDGSVLTVATDGGDLTLDRKDTVYVKLDDFRGFGDKDD